MSVLTELKLANPAHPNIKRTPPTFFSMVGVRACGESKGENTWKGWSFERMGYITELYADNPHAVADLYSTGKAFAENIAGGLADADYDAAASADEEEKVVGDTGNY